MELFPSDHRNFAFIFAFLVNFSLLLRQIWLEMISPGRHRHDFFSFFISTLCKYKLRGVCLILHQNIPSVLPNIFKNNETTLISTKEFAIMMEFVSFFKNCYLNRKTFSIWIESILRFMLTVDNIEPIAFCV